MWIFLFFVIFLCLFFLWLDIFQVFSLYHIGYVVINFRFLHYFEIKRFKFIQYL